MNHVLIIEIRNTLKMFERYIEIDTFFKQKQFSQEELDVFRDNLIKKKGAEYEKSIQNFINLNLTKFRINSNSRKSKSSRKQDDKIQKNRFEYNSTVTLTELSENLDFTVNFLKRIFLQKGIQISESEYVLKKQEIVAIRPLIESRLNSIERKKAKKERSSLKWVKPTKKKYNPNRNDRVYDKIKQHGMSKLIYIRKSN